MKEINFQGLPKDMTIGEIVDMENKLKDLPEGFKITYKDPKIKTADEIIEELEKEKRT